MSGTTGGGFAPNKIEFPTDAGEPQQRQRYPVGRIIRSGTWQFNIEQNSIFTNFYWSICNSGTLPFWHYDWVFGDFVVWQWYGEPPSFAEQPVKYVQYDLQFSRRRP